MRRFRMLVKSSSLISSLQETLNKVRASAMGSLPPVVPLPVNGDASVGV
jgi:hypothetical protein